MLCLNSVSFAAPQAPDCNSAAACRQKSIDFYLNRQFDLAIQTLRKATDLDSGSCQSYALLFNVYMAKKQYRHALKAIDKAIKCQPENYDYLYFRGIAYQALGDYRFAFDDFDIFLKHNEGAAYKNELVADIYARQGIMFSKVGRYQDALPFLQKANGMGVRRHELFAWLGMIRFNKGDFAKALANYKIAIDLVSSHPEILFLALR